MNYQAMNLETDNFLYVLKEGNSYVPSQELELSSLITPFVWIHPPLDNQMIASLGSKSGAGRNLSYHQVSDHSKSRIEIRSWAKHPPYYSI